MARNPRLFPKEIRHMVEPLTYATPTEQNARNIIDLLLPIIKQEICVRAIETVSDLYDLKNKRVHVSYCEEHKSFHSFDSNYSITSPLKKLKDSNTNRALALFKAEYITVEQYENSIANWELIKMIVHNNTSREKEEELPEFFRQSLIYSRKLSARKKFFDPERGFPDFTYVEELSDEQVLLWYQCHRKTPYTTEKEIPSGAMNQWKHIYHCEHCEQYHVGSSEGDTSRNSQLHRARKMLNLLTTNLT